MKKSEVCVKLTRKNCKKVLGILEMFEEPIHRSTFDRISISDLDGFYIEFWKNKWIDSSNDENKTPIKSRELRNILAKKHLKAGDVIEIKGIFGDKKIAEILLINKKCFSFESLDKKSSGMYQIDDLNFIRFATDEEKSMLEPKLQISEVDPVETKCGLVDGFTRYTQEVWVNHYSDQEFHVYKTRYGAESGRRPEDVQTVKATLTYDIPMTKV